MDEINRNLEEEISEDEINAVSGGKRRALQIIKKPIPENDIAGATGGVDETEVNNM